jgi:DNA-binding transcriptional MerR regulator
MVIRGNYLSEAETAEELGVKVKTLRAWAMLKKSPSRTKIGRKIFYREEDLINWIESKAQFYDDLDE